MIKDQDETPSAKNVETQINDNVEQNPIKSLKEKADRFREKYKIKDEDDDKSD